jgi:filamentous hemagglutinin family protein
MSYVRQSLAASSSVVTLSIALLASGQVFASGLPTKGHFAAGEGVIGKAASSLTVKQSSVTGVINWKSFSVGQKNNVTFDNGSGATLNRVTGGNLSTIAGSLHATGSLYLMNTQGVIVSGTGRVVTGGNFVATSGNLSNTAFGTDDLRARTAKAAVINHGSITAGGNASLVGSAVRNTGTIHAASVDLRGGADGVQAGGIIHADGSATQSGGILLISKTGETKVTGDLVARNANGTGGSIETSGHTVALSGSINAGKGGQWLVDPVNLTVKSKAAKTIDKALNAGTNVTLQTGKNSASGAGSTSSGPGDITIDSALAWNSAAVLSLQAYHSILVDKNISVNGSGGVNLETATSGGDGNLRFEGGHMTFASTSDALDINGDAYKLVDNITTLANDIAHNSAGNYALANSYNAAADGTYGSAPIGTVFQGQFQGLGNAISNLTIDDTGDFKAGLFKTIGYYGVVDNLELANVNVAGGGDVGGLAGMSRGVTLGDSVSGVVNGGKDAYVGGLVGSLRGGLVDDSSSSATVYARSSQGHIGGLVGYAYTGLIENSHASGTVTAGHDASVGGLIGSGRHFEIQDSYATGAVNDTANGNTGGLAGKLVDTSVDGAYATGNVTGENGAWAGGLIGYNDDSSISNAYATGNVTAGSNANVGGFAGLNYGDITAAYSTGQVTGGSNTYIGGFVGNEQNAGGIQSAYWDTTTSGITGLSQGAGNGANDPGVKGITDTVLKSGLPAGFDSSVWAQSASVNGGLPYLIGLTPS